jgi:hypothetical protein
LLRTLGLSPQRPVLRASQQDPERVTRWREQDYPMIRDEAAQVGVSCQLCKPRVDQDRPL